MDPQKMVEAMDRHTAQTAKVEERLQELAFILVGMAATLERLADKPSL